jgi:hypothetical protein
MEGLVIFIKSLKKIGINYKLITPSYIKIKIKQLINKSLNSTTAYLACLEALRGLIPKQIVVWDDIRLQVKEFFDLARRKKSIVRDILLKKAIKVAK